MDRLFLACVLSAIMAALITPSLSLTPPGGDPLSDTRITRVRPLTTEDKLRTVVPRVSARSIYLANVIPAPAQDQENSRDLHQARDPNRRLPTLFLLQPVQDNGRLPDGIYYKPAEGEPEPPATIQKDISSLHAFILGRTPRIGRPAQPEPNKQATTAST